MSIHHTAVIARSAEIGKDNQIGPHVVIDGNVRIGNNNRIGPGTIITGNTCIGDGNIIHGHVYLGNTPQDVSYRGQETQLVVGDHNEFREFSNAHRGTREGTATVIGNHNYFMVSAHIAHNCRIGNHVFMVNGASLGGYCEVHDHAFVSAYVIVHQFVRIGAYAICGILTKLTQDVPPFMMVDGNPAVVRSLNVVGLRRNGFNPQRRAALKRAYKVLYRSRLSVSSGLLQVRGLLDGETDREIRDDLNLLLSFIQGSKRGILLRSAAGSGEEGGT